MIQAAELNSLILCTVAITAVTITIIQVKRTVANYQTPLDSKSIVSLLRRNGSSSSVMGSWIVFNYQGQEYTINTSKLPVLVIIKQTSIEKYKDNTSILREVAQAVSLDTVLAMIHVAENPANRAVIQLNAIETCLGAFAQRLNIYLDIIEETEKRFFEEIERNK